MKIKILIITLFCSTILFAQENQISDIVRIDLPARATKLSIEEVRSLVAQRKRDSILTVPTLPVFANNDYYLIDSFLISLHGERWIVPYQYLENTQRDIDGGSKVDGMNVHWVFETKKINNYTVLIANLDSRDWGSYIFFSVNRRNNAVLNGGLLYLKSGSRDKDKASKVLNELLLGIAYVL